MIDIGNINNGKLLNGDSAIELKRITSESIDVIVTDPPYGYSFMGKNWDKALPDIKIFKECLRVLKPGAFAFVMAAPRQDVLSHMIIKLKDAGFKTNYTSIYWTYAQGFPKANNIGKSIDKKLAYKREVIGTRKQHDIRNSGYASKKSEFVEEIKGGPVSQEAKQFEGSYGGFQPKPAVEVIIVVQKPFTQKTQAGQALDNGKGVTWLDDCRIPYADDGDQATYDFNRRGASERLKKDYEAPYEGGWKKPETKKIPQGRFPANLLVSDNVLQHESKGALAPVKLGQKGFGGEIYGKYKSGEDEGKSFYSDKKTSTSYSRFFSLDAWAEKNLPFLIVPKSSKKEKDAGIKGEKKPIDNRTDTAKDSIVEKGLQPGKNNHETVKPIKL